MRWFDPLLRPELSQLAAYVPHPPRANAIRLDANELSVPLSPEGRALLARELASVATHRYPDPRATTLRSLLAKSVGADPTQLVFGSGSDEVIALLLTTIAHPKPGRARAVCMYPSPTFVMYRASAIAAGMEPVGVPLDASWGLDWGAMRKALDEHDPSVLFLASPNNPTAACFRDEDIKAIVAACEGRTLVVLDEAYGAYSSRHYRDLRAQHPHVAQLGTLSKVGLAAARVGWAVLPEGLASEVDKVRQPYNLSSLAQRAGELAFTDLAAEIARSVELVRSERSRLSATLGTLPGVTVHPSDANFLWVDAGRDAGVVHQELVQRDIVVRSFHASATLDARLKTHLRITVGTPSENDALIEALRAIVR